MRTNIVINDKLIKDALRLSGLPTKREVVEESLRLFVQMQRQKRMKNMFGKLRWQGDLDALRTD